MTDAPDLEPAAEIKARAASILCEAGTLCGWPAPNCNAREGAEALYQAGLLAARSVPEAGKAVVKPLEWRYFAGAFPVAWDAKTPFERYSIEERWGPNVEPPDWHQDVDSTWALAYGVQLVGVYKTLEAAKAAAQADYEQRIRAALASSPAPTGAVPVAWRWKLPSDTKWQFTDGPEKPRLGLPTSFEAAALKEPTYASPQAAAPTGEIAGLVERLRAPDKLYNRGPGYEPLTIPASDIRLEAAAALTSLSANARAAIDAGEELIKILRAERDDALAQLRSIKKGEA